MATIHVDGKQYEVDGSDNLLRACLSLGLDIPYFCWHPALGSVGACRQCAVKQYANADDKRGRLVMSCMTQSTDNTFISIDDEEARQFRASVVEWLMTNHPHDCPVCEEGGHCHLQDMTVMTGHNTRRYRFSKRTHQNQDLGPFINHEMNRCIACYRCVRYYNDYAGGTDLGVYGAHDNVYFGRVEDGTLESEFSGNLTEVCPTGVFTDKTHSERYNRKWDMQFAPSVCQGCAVGCNISPGERYGELRRIENRYNGAVNHYFLCDRGRFGYGFVNREDRPRQPQQLESGHFVARSLDVALDGIAAEFKNARRVIGIGSPRASLEGNHALRELVGPANFFAGVSASELAADRAALAVLQQQADAVPSLRAIEDKDAVLVLGEDLTQTAARVALALRQSVKNKPVQMAADRKVGDWNALGVRDIGQRARSPLFSVTVQATRLDDVAEASLQLLPEDIARFGFAVAHAIDAAAPAVADLPEAARALVQPVADALLAAASPLVVSGTSLASPAIVEAAANITRALQARGKSAAISLALAEVNSLGLTLMGGDSLDAALSQLAAGDADAVVVLENDLYRRAPAARVDAALANARLIVVDHQLTSTGARAHWLLPAASFAEADGTVVSAEGRAQRYFQVYDPAYYDDQVEVRDGWRWLHALHSTLQGESVRWMHLDDVIAATVSAFPVLAGIVEAAPSAGFRIKGLKIAREPRRYSGRTAMRANISVHEPRATQDADSALAFSMEGLSGPDEPTQLTPFAWAPGWNSPQAWNKFQDEVGGHLKAGDSGVRLLTPTGTTAYYAAKVALPAGDGLRVLPLFHLFGSDELSARSDVTSERQPAPYAALSPQAAAQLGVGDGGTVRIWMADATLELPVQVRDDLSADGIGLPIGLPQQPYVARDVRVTVSGVSA
ncbi:NADH-quinone oxidoreductase subunit NuoG [Perlucidibaca piscinae]|uniref:NADH-quinone oxidoreductase subunit NuoG n=1 Tax=Perlucidibaca piscinae TaxID=392589 RepID=UPI0003B50B22|nr:NADH-quinone oxidoreductase subunit NuoG [Perlucidibaca piscinae]